MGVDGFGYKNTWFAVRDRRPEALASALGLEVLRACEWNEGVAHAYDGHVFITPELDGWTLAVGTGLLKLADAAMFAATTERIASSLATEAQFFGTHRVVETHGWARATPAGLSRAYMYIGDRGETVADVGPPSHEEQQLGFRFFDERSPESSQDGYWERTDLTFPNEEHVMRLAGRWSVDPTTLEGRELPFTSGLLCRNPSGAENQSANSARTSRQRRWWRFW